jgi:hypothetical protein
MWAQWRAIGGSANTAQVASTIVDPEALILASLFYEDEEPRLRTVLYAWVERNASLLSVGRLRRLAKPYPLSVSDKLRQFATAAARLAKQPRWAALTNDHATGTVAIERFATSRAVAPVLEAPPALMLRLRAALGVGAKADALTYLLGQVERGPADPTTVRAISNAVGYTSVAIRSALEDLAAARFVIATTDRPVAFMAPERSWRDLLNIASVPPWWPWHQIYVFASLFLEWSDRMRSRNVSDAVLRIHQQQLLEKHPVVRQLISRHERSSFVAYAPGKTMEPVSVLTNWMRTPGAL